MRRYRRLYAVLLRLYPEAFHARFAEGMAQTFHDLCRERVASGERIFPYALGIFAETSAGIFRERMDQLNGPLKRLARVALVTATLLLIPFVATRLSDDVTWTRSDFVVAGILFFGAGLLIELGASKAGSTPYRVATGLAVGASLLLIWVNLAVGLIGSENNPANLLYLAVLVVGAIAAGMARFRPQGMARALYAMAFTQILVPFVALAIWRPQVQGSEEAVGMVGVLFASSIFAVLFFVAGLLFRRASELQPER